MKSEPGIVQGIQRTCCCAVFLAPERNPHLTHLFALLSAQKESLLAPHSTHFCTENGGDSVKVKNKKGYADFSLPRMLEQSCVGAGTVSISYELLESKVFTWVIERVLHCYCPGARDLRRDWNEGEGSMCVPASLKLKL